jgi:hypothetical protein
MRHPVRERLDNHEDKLSQLSAIGSAIVKVLTLIAALLLIGLCR